MTRQELLDRANAYFAERGWGEVSDRQLSDWRDEQLLPGPIPLGRRRGLSPDWDWSEEALAIVLEIGRLKSLGAKRASQLRCYLWISGRQILRESARKALTTEFDRLVAKTRRQLRDFTSSTSRAALVSRIGQVDPTLAPLAPEVSATEPFALEALDEITSGEAGLPLLSDAIDRRYPGAADLLSASRNAEIVLIGMSGLFGLSDETDQSATAVIRNATAEEFEAARYATLAQYFAIYMAIDAGFLWHEDALPAGVLDKILSLDSCDWAITLFVQSLNGIYKISRFEDSQMSR